ncbi:hypothetical protein GYH46_02225 [Escherichia coli]|nr:hypothetical protein [Escherichia coli]
MNELVQILKNTRQHLMTGVSHMIPFVVSGGILLAVSVMLYGKGAVPDAVADPNLKKLFDIGVAGLTLMVPFLAAYIGYSIAERSALAPCAIGAWVGNSFGAGFFGALIAGIIGGIVVHYLKKIPVHKVLRSVMPIFIIPIVGTLITAGVMMWGLGEPVGALTNSLTQWLQGMQQGSIVMLAVIMGLMLAFDMGGPVNKAKLTTRGAMLGGWLGLITAVVLMILGPTIWVQILGHEKAIFPYEYPALFSISVAFLGIWLFSATDNSAEGARERELFRAQFIRSQTGFGVEQGRAH